MQGLAGRAVAVLGIKRLLSTQLICHATTVTAGLVASGEVFSAPVNGVRNTLLPIVFAHLAAGKVKRYSRGAKGPDSLRAEGTVDAQVRG